MGLRINTNVASINAQRSLSETKGGLEKAFQRLASGQRINRAQDDAAGLAISENLRGQLRSLTQAGRNAEDGISLVQVAEGAVNEISNILIRLRELSIQSASDTIGNRERGFLDLEFQALKEEIQRITETTRFTGTQLLDGSGGVLEVQVGIYNDDFQDRINIDTGKSNTNLDTLKIKEVSISQKESAQNVLTNLDMAIAHVASVRSNYGAFQNRLESTMKNIAIFHENLSAANSRIRDADIAKESAELTRGSIMQQASVSVLAQANAIPQTALKLLQ